MNVVIVLFLVVILSASIVYAWQGDDRMTVIFTRLFLLVFILLIVWVIIQEPGHGCYYF